MVNRFSNSVLAYDFDEEGRIAYAPDFGTEGDLEGASSSKSKFPTLQRYGWWENEMMEVMFESRSLSVFEIIDSSYLTALDKMKILNEDDVRPLEYSFSYVQAQSTLEGDVTRAGVAFARYDPETGETDPLKILMSTGLFGVKYLLLNAPMDLLDKPIDKWNVDEQLKKRARGAGHTSGVIFRPSFEAAKDMWVVDDVRMKQLAQYGIENQRLTMFHTRAREGPAGCAHASGGV